MKKLFAFISILAVAAAALFADVSAKKNADGTVDVTFFYGNPRASEVLLAGDFTSWQDGALPMTKGEKGFSITRTFKMGEEARYKFISDGNWTTDLRAPAFVDDGFGGKNAHIVVADLVAGDGDDSGAAKAKINFVSWSMIGLQGQYNTSKVTDDSSRGIDLDNVTVGFKSYDKFTGMFLPNAPFFIELAISQMELDPHQNDGKNYLYKLDRYGEEEISFKDGVREFVNGITAHPVSYLAGTTNNSEGNKGPGSNPFLGHLKFGWNTPYINFLTGFNYAKPTTQNSILWTTVDGSNWDAGYEHVGGFSEFSLGSKAVAALEEATGLTFNAVFAPNKSADRKGYKYGLWSILGVKNDTFAAEVQYNSFYLGDELFYKPFEHDIILGAKGNIGSVKVAGQMLINSYQNIDDMYKTAGGNDFSKVMDLFGYSRSAVAFKDDGFEFAKHTAAEVNAQYKNDFITLTADYRYRGWEANMLYVHDHHCDYGKDTQTAQLGQLNTQRFTLDAVATPTESLSIKFTPYFELPFVTTDWDAYSAMYSGNSTPNSRIDFASKDSKLFVGYLKADYKLDDLIGKKSSISAYGKVKAVTEDEDKYVGYDSKFLFANAGLKFSLGDMGDTFKGFDLYYGLDNTNSTKMFNTVVASLNFASDVRADVAFGIRSATKEYDGDINHPFGFGVGVSKKFKAMKKPTVYAQFVYDIDPYKNFGDGQDNLNLDGYCLSEKVKKAAGSPDEPKQDAVDVYEGKAALRVGVRWDI